MILKDQLLLVGWYHSHPKFQAEPSLRDCDIQLDFQVRMRGSSDITYTPCISTIISSYYDGNPTFESVIKTIWVTPPIENKQILEYGRPMMMNFSVLLEKELPEYVRYEIQACAEYYFLFGNEFVKFDSVFSEDTTFLEKLKITLFSKFPLNENNTKFWNWICEILSCKKEEEFNPPKKKVVDGNDTNSIKIRQYSAELLSHNTSNSHGNISFKLDKNDFDKKISEIKVMSLQEQLCLPSGLNMNPVRTFAPLATPNLLSTENISTLVTANSESSTCQVFTNPVIDTICPGVLSPTPSVSRVSINTADIPSTLSVPEVTSRDSPITVLSSSAGPAKSSEVPIQSSPSPPKSETSLRSHNSPVRSPRNNSNIAKNNSNIKIDAPKTLQPESKVLRSKKNDFVPTNLTQLADQLAPSFLQNDLSSLLQQHLTCKNYSNQTLNQVISEKSGEEKNNLNETVVRGYSKDVNTPLVQEPSLQNQLTGNPKYMSGSSRLSSPVTFSSNASNLYKTKLMKELDSIKNDPLKINELIRSPEYAALLLHQAEALGATTLGSLGLGSDLNFLVGSNFGSKINPSQTTDYNNLFQASKLLGYESCMQQAKSEDLNTFLQQQMGAVAAAALVNATLSSSLGTHKKQKQSEGLLQNDYSSLLHTYTKLFESGNNFRDDVNEGKIPSCTQNELETLLSTRVDSEVSILDSKPKTKDVSLRMQQKQNETQSHIQNSFFYNGCKTSSELSALFAASSAGTNLAITNKLVNSNANSDNVPSLVDSAMYYSTFPIEKAQDYSYFQQQQGKHESNFFISPTAMMKLQKDSLTAMMMKPPKSTSSTLPSLSRNRETTASPALGRLTPTKNVSPNACSSANLKYNFSAMDLAVSSIQPNMSESVPLDAGNTSALFRGPSNTPPVDLSSFLNEGQPPSSVALIKKRMEFSSIADLAAPPPAKFPKVNEDTHPNT